MQQEYTPSPRHLPSKWEWAAYVFTLVIALALPACDAIFIVAKVSVTVPIAAVSVPTNEIDQYLSTYCVITTPLCDEISYSEHALVRLSSRLL